VKPEIPDIPDLRARFEEFAARFAEKARSGAHAARPAFKEAYWQSVQDLFTRDVTPRGFEQLVRHDAGETLRFFAREVALEDLSGLPAWKRYPLAAWRLFLAMAYRLSPPRRVVFALSVPLLFLGWMRYLITFVGALFGGAAVRAAWEDWMLLAGTLVLALLLLELRDKLSLKGDLEVARQIQFGLLPFEPYRRGGIAVQASMRPANTVGGDYFDVVELDEDKLAVVVGDVAGKGMPAALLMALLQGSLRTLITAGLRGTELMAKLNAHLYTNIPSNRLVTFFYAEVSASQGLVRYVNAGHNPPLVMRADGRIEKLDATAVALGVLADTPFEAREIVLEPGERLFLYTDGVTEAFNVREEEFGEIRLQETLRARRGLENGALIQAVRDDVMAFCGPMRPRDDMTLLVLSREA
jgi:phosphoserine phosphatase RsbU/P